MSRDALRQEQVNTHSAEARLGREISGVLFFLMAALTAFAFYFGANRSGLFGLAWRRACMGIFGPVAYSLPFFFAFWGTEQFFRRQSGWRAYRAMHLLIILTLIAALWQSFAYPYAQFEDMLNSYVERTYLADAGGTRRVEASQMLEFIWLGSADPVSVTNGGHFVFGGILGSSLSLALHRLMGHAGACIFLLFSLLIEMIIVFDFSLLAAGRSGSEFLLRCGRGFLALCRRSGHFFRDEKTNFDECEAALRQDFYESESRDSGEDRRERDETAARDGRGTGTEMPGEAETGGAIAFPAWYDRLPPMFRSRRIMKRIKQQRGSMTEKNIFPFFTFDDEKMTPASQKRLFSRRKRGMNESARPSEDERSRRETHERKNAPAFLCDQEIERDLLVAEGKACPSFLDGKELRAEAESRAFAPPTEEQSGAPEYLDLLIPDPADREAYRRTAARKRFQEAARQREVLSRAQERRREFEEAARLLSAREAGNAEDKERETEGKKKLAQAIVPAGQDGMRRAEGKRFVSEIETVRTAEAEGTPKTGFPDDFLRRHDLSALREEEASAYFKDALPECLRGETEEEKNTYLTGDGILSAEERELLRLNHEARMRRIAEKEEGGVVPPEAEASSTETRHDDAASDKTGELRVGEEQWRKELREETDLTLLPEREAAVSSRDGRVEDKAFESQKTEREKIRHIEAPRSSVGATVFSARRDGEKQKTAQTPSLRGESRATSSRAQSKSEPKPYVFPPLSLLKNAPPQSRTNRYEIEQMANKLVQLLHTFGVETTLSNITSGPTITRFELTPGVGVRVSKIVNLSEDIALGLAVSSLRIEAPIPGRSAVGIEVPNRQRETVYLRPLLESEALRQSRSKLSTPLGRDIPGEAIICDLAKMPHLLIAGATGSGKSICINSIMMSLLYRATPQDLRFILIDPKVVELSVYNGIPHLLSPVVTDPQKASNSLNWAVEEMNRRFNLFARKGARDIDRYNQAVEESLRRRTEEREQMLARARRNDPLRSEEERRELVNAALPLPAEEKFPYILIVIDELADLMAVVKNEVENSIARLAAKGRAAGMHLIIATQRPSVDVITGTIKSNIPSRLAFGVSSQIDSRTILDTQGAEKLLGRGDLLYQPMSENKSRRGQGAFVSDQEAEAVLQFIREHNSSEMDMEMAETIQGSSSEKGETNNVKDELYDEAVEILLEAGSASASVLQRRLTIGYPRAARLIDLLEDDHIIGPHEGSRPRKLKITREDWEQILASRKQ